MSNLDPNSLSGTLERITFQNPDNDFCIAKLLTPLSPKPIAILGALKNIHPGQTLELKGQWIEDPKYGRQFKVSSFKALAPVTEKGIIKYLSSGIISGIGPKFAEKIVAKFGLKTLLILESQPSKLLEIEGLGKKKLNSLVKSLEEQKEVQHIFVFLQSHGVTKAFAAKIFKKYGDKSIETVEGNPYQIARDIKGIGFKLADRIALSLKFEKESPQRALAGIEYTLEELSLAGHTCYPKKNLIQEVERLIDVSLKEPELLLNQLVEENRIVLVEQSQEPYVALKSFYLSELGASREVKRLQEHACALRAVDEEKALHWVSEKLHLKFAKAQIEAIKASLREKVMVITGGPGTGKSTITKAILKILSKLTSKIICAAPTGRAAKRMTEITYFKASTLHSLLKFDPKSGRFVHNQKNPLNADLVLVDEASMIDAKLFYHFLKALSSSCRLILIGDIDQLPSVGAGNVLRDLIDSEALTVSRLSFIFRQGKGSKISYNAHLINQGYFPKLEEEKGDDFSFIEAKEPQEVLNAILDLVSTQLPQKNSFDPLKEIQVLAPMKKGPIGTDQLNQKLQALLNPGRESLYYQGRLFCEQDKVIQLKNNYTKEVYNGDIGFIDWISKENQELAISYDNREVLYSFSELDQVQLAYCVSIHKYQGSESPCVVMPIHTHHFKLLCRNLLYTGLTRGKKRVVLVGTKKALAIAVKNNEILFRHTLLKNFLKTSTSPSTTEEQSLSF